jgi:hypothetical protein
MGPVDALWHLLGLFTMAAFTGVLSAALAKVLWRRELAAVRLPRLATLTVLAGCVVSAISLALTGRDGSMAGYGALVLANALTLWWRGFGPGRA